MARLDKHLYEFGPFRLDTGERVLLRNGQVVPLRPKVFDMLAVLIGRRGRLVEKDELLNKVWPGQFVEEGNLNKNISMLRQALGETPTTHQYIETIPKHGYRFVGNVYELPGISDEVFVVERRSRTRLVAEEEETESHDSPVDRTAGQSGFHVSDENLTRRSRVAGSAVKFVALAVVIVFAASVALLLGVFSGDKTSQQRLAISPIVLTPLGNTANAVDAAITPDGKYVAFVLLERGRESLWLKQLATSSDYQLLPPEEVKYRGLTFSPDGNFIYYAILKKEEPAPILYRIPALGGVSTRIMNDVWTRISFSPDRTRFAFVRRKAGDKENTLMVANADGREETALVTRTVPDSLGAPAWSPDGRSIACAAGNADTGGANYDVIEVRLADQTERVITSQKLPWVNEVTWLPNGSGLLVSAKNRRGEPSQLWFLSYSEGSLQKVTNDSNSYHNINLAENALVTVRKIPHSDIWVMPGAEEQQVRKITSGYDGLSWTPDGRIVYPSFVNDKQDLWVMQADGNNKRQLTVDAGANIGPTVCRDGRYIVFVSNRSGIFNIWRLDLDGSNPVRLTHGNGENGPQCSPDGKWVIYFSTTDRSLWKVPIEGGTPIQISKNYTNFPAVSPDGKRIAYFQRDGTQNSRLIIAVVPFEGGEPMKVNVADLEVGAPQIRWSREGDALLYVLKQNGIPNIWRHPLGGTKPQQLTHFSDPDEIFGFDWSYDGQHLACWRAGWTSELILIRNS